MKVLLFSAEYPPMIGGGGTYTSYLAQALSKSGIEVAVLTSGDIDKKETEGRVVVFRRKSLLELYFGKTSYHAPIRDFLEVLKDFSPDVVHASHADMGLISLIVKNSLKFPLVYTPHKTPEKSGKIKIINDKWAISDFVMSQKLDKIIVSSLFFKEEATRSAVFKKNIKLIYPSVNTDIFFRQSEEKIKNFRKEIGIKEGEFLVVCPAKIRTRKGLDFLVQACCLLGENLPIHLLITGEPDNEKERAMAEKLKNMAKDHKLPLIIKSFNFDKVPSVLSSADVVALVSSHEGLGMALIEAMACGVPVVGSRVEGVSEVVKDGYNGLLAGYNNIEELKNSLLNILSDKKLRRRLINNGLKTVDKKFNSINWAESHKKVYEELIKKYKNEIS